MPLQCVTGLYVMYSSVGVAAFAGMTAMILEAIPLQGKCFIMWFEVAGTPKFEFEFLRLSVEVARKAEVQNCPED